MSQAQSPTAILQELIAFKTISGTSNTPMIEYLESFAQRNNFNYERIKNPSDIKRANLLCWAGPPCKGGLMICGHTDVVPVAAQAWDSDPFVLHEQDGKLFGRGSADMKGFIAATCHALEGFDHRKLSRPLSLLFTYDEEIGCDGSALAAPLLRKILPSMPEAALIGEPTDFRILRMHSGHVTLKITARGKGAHSSDPALGNSAIKAMHQVLSGLFVLEHELKNEVSLADFFPRPYVILNVGLIQGGSAVNIIPDEALIIIGFRPLPEISVEAIIDRINLIIERVSHDSGALIFLTKEHYVPAMITKAGTKLERILSPHAYASDHVAAAFSTDAGNLKQEDIECLIFGPGNINNAHKANEYIYKRDLNSASQKISEIVIKYLI